MFWNKPERFFFSPQLTFELTRSHLGNLYKSKIIKIKCNLKYPNCLQIVFNKTNIYIYILYDHLGILT